MYVHACVPEEHSKNDKSIAAKSELTVVGKLLASSLCECFETTYTSKNYKSLRHTNKGILACTV